MKVWIVWDDSDYYYAKFVGVHSSEKKAKARIGKIRPKYRQKHYDIQEVDVQ